MGTYVYSGLHPRNGTIPIHTFFPLHGGKPVVAMKSCIVIEGQSLQRVMLNDVKATLSAYEQFLIPEIFETDAEYDYAMVVENLDNNSVPDKIKNCSCKPSATLMGIIIDQDPLDETYTVGCGPLVFINVKSKLALINPQLEFLSVQTQKSSNSRICHKNICGHEALIRKLLDPVTVKNGQVTPSPVAVAQTQSKPTKSYALDLSTLKFSPVSTKSPLSQTQENPTQERHVTSFTGFTSLQSCNSSSQKTPSNTKKSVPFKPFTGLAGSLRSKSPELGAESNPDTYSGSSSPLNSESHEDYPWDTPEPADPYAKPDMSFIKALQIQQSTTPPRSTNLQSSTTSASLSYVSFRERTQSTSSKNRSNLTLSTRSSTSLIEETPSDMPELADPYAIPDMSFSSFYKTLLQQNQETKLKSSNFKPSTNSNSTCLSSQTQRMNSQLTPSASSASSSFLESLYPRGESKQGNHLTSSASSSFLESLYPRTQHGQLNPFRNSAGPIRSDPVTPQTLNNTYSSRQESPTPQANSSCLDWSTSTTNSLKYESLQPQAPDLPTRQHSTSSLLPVIGNVSATDMGSEMSLENFEALKPTLSSLEKKHKIIEEIMTVTI